jgi:acetylornithine deacetylase/succinyl-diaminopimelate desuccinylase-like protein
MTREAVFAAAGEHFDSGAFLRDLARRVAIRTESQNPASGPELQRYLTDEISPSLAALGFTSTIHANPVQPYGPLLISRRVEDPSLPTVLMYGHGDVIRGQDASWTRGRGPRRRALVRPGHRRQQGPAQHQHRRAGAGAGAARPPGLQRHLADRDR